MAASKPVPVEILHWLHNTLRSDYADVNRTYLDVANTLSIYKSLSPRTEIYTSEYGHSNLLLLLQGTLPVVFRSNAYHIPVNLWIPHVYPQQPPTLYVTPSSGLELRPGPHISMEGRVYHPYLAHWAQQSSTSSITGLLGIMSDVFAKEPPLVARQQYTQDSRSGVLANNFVTPSRIGNLLPEATATTGSISRGHDQKRLRAPAPPPKPPEVQLHSTKSNSSNGLSVDEQANENTSVNGCPRRDVSSARGRGNVVGTPIAAVQSDNANSVNQHIKVGYQDTSQQTANHNHNLAEGGSTPMSTNHVNVGGSRQVNEVPVALRHMQGQLSAHHAGPGRPPSNRPRNNGMVRSDSLPKAPVRQTATADILSLPMDSSNQLATQLSQDQVTAPPIPPNPERNHLIHEIASRLSVQLDDEFRRCHTTFPALDAQERALLDAQSRLQIEHETLEALSSQIVSNEQILHESMREATQLVESLAQKDAPAVDDMLVAPTVVGEQLYKLITNERSTADAMFALTKALNMGRVSVDVYVKQTRGLAREQFLQKALIQKLARGIGISDAAE